MTKVNVYLTFNGNCREAFDFYAKAFKKSFDYIGTFGEMPPGPHSLGPEHADKIMHVSLPISDETMLLASDTGGEWATDYTAGNNFSISISTGSKEEADRLFAELSEGGQVTMPMEATFCGDYFGIKWMVSFNEGKPES